LDHGRRKPKKFIDSRAKINPTTIAASIILFMSRFEVFTADADLSEARPFLQDRIDPRKPARMAKAMGDFAFQLERQGFGLGHIGAIHANLGNPGGREFRRHA
jgi:hypothetical protein